MNRYFYQIEDNGKGEKIIHLLGNVYYNDYTYTVAEWTFFYIDIDKAKDLIKCDTFCYAVDSNIDYIDDITESEADEISRTYFDGESGIELPIEDITADTPCGSYYFNIV